MTVHTLPAVALPNHVFIHVEARTELSCIPSIHGCLSRGV